MKFGVSRLLLICSVIVFGALVALQPPAYLERGQVLPSKQSMLAHIQLSGSPSPLLAATKQRKALVDPLIISQEAAVHVLPRDGQSQKLSHLRLPQADGDHSHEMTIRDLNKGMGVSRGESVGSILHESASNSLWHGAAPEDPAWMRQAQARCFRILKKLWARQGGIALPDIRLMEIAAFGKPAEYDVANKRILLDPRAYQLCLNLPEFGEEALAFLIAHELIHSYQHNSFDYHSLGFFVKSNTLKGWAQQDRMRRKNMETQADIWGAVLCYMAGYQVDQSIPDFIEQLYHAFELDEEDPSYDSKTERLDIAQRAQLEVRKSIDIFEMASYLSVLQEHDKDTTLYRYLIDQFRSAEFYNNLGVSYLRLALPKLDEPYRSLPYPFLLDTETRLEQAISKRRSSPGFLIRQGLKNFDKIPSLSASYAPAQLNRAVGLHLLSAVEEDQAAFHLQHAREALSRVNSGKLREEVHLVRELIQSPGTQVMPRSYVEAIDPVHNAGNIDQINFDDGYALDDLKYDWEATVSFAEGITVSALSLPHSELLCFQDKGRFEHFFLQRISQPIDLPSHYRGKVHQVGKKISPKAKSVLRTSLPTANGGCFFVDDALGIVYRIGSDELVREWAVWRKW